MEPVGLVAYTFKFRELEGEAVRSLYMWAGSPFRFMNLLDSFVLSPRFCVCVYPYYTRYPACCTTTLSPLRLLRVRDLHSPSSSWVSTTFYPYCVHLIVSEP
jgi:hypothetical protein